MQNTLELLPDSNPVAFERLLELTDQGQFEMIYPDDLKQGKIRLIYMMNDAAESFLVFEQARMKGKYKKDFEGEIEAELHLMKDQQEYGLIIRQAENVFTLFFRNLTAEERRLIFNALLSLRNKLIAQGRYTDAVDELMIKIRK